MIYNIKFKKVYILILPLSFLYSCSDDITKSSPNHLEIKHSTKSAGGKKKLSPNKYHKKVIKNEYIFSRKDWQRLCKCRNKARFIELKNKEHRYCKEPIDTGSRDFPNSDKIISKTHSSGKKGKKEITVVFLHGLAGKEGDFFKLISKLSSYEFEGNINFMSVKRYDSCFKSIQQQAEEVTERLISYFNKYKYNNEANDIILVGHSQGGIIALSILEILQKIKNINVKGIVLIGTPLKGVDSTQKYMKKTRRKYPSVISIVENSILGCTLEDNPKGIIGLASHNIKPIVDKAHNIINQKKIPVKNIVGLKPAYACYPNSVKKIIKNLPTLLKHRVISKKNSNFKLGELLKLNKIMNKTNLFDTKKLTGSDENDLLLSKNTQIWPYENEYIKTIFKKNTVHNWKISLLVSSTKRIKPELETDTLKINVKELIELVLNNNSNF